MRVKSHQLVNPNDLPQKPSSERQQLPEMDIRFVSLTEKRQIQGIETMTEILKSQGYNLDYFEYKVIKKSEMRRPINPSVKNSPTEKIVVEERVNVNANLKTVGQLEWRVLKEPENVLLVQINRSKGESLSLPLFFDNIIKNNKQILICGLNNALKLQLLSKPDLKFTKIPEPIELDSIVKEQLLERASRSKGMQSTARELLDFPGLPTDISAKIAAIATGKKEPLSAAQSINLILLSDLHSRYGATFQTFQNEIIGRSSSVANLARQFDILTQKISTKFLVSQFLDFLGENAGQCRNNQQIFTFLYQKLQQMEEKPIYVNKKLLDRKDLFKLLRSIVCIARSQFDPLLWSQCLYFLTSEDVQTLPEENEKSIQKLVASSLQGKSPNKMKGSKNLMENYVVNNIYDFVIDKKIAFAEDRISKQEAITIKSIIAPRFHLKVKKGGTSKSANLLFGEAEKGAQKLNNPLHFIASTYGSLVGELLKENLKKFLVQDKKQLIERFGIYFFDVLYEQSVFETGLHLSRNQFAGWLEESQLVAKPHEFGYLANEIETDFDPALTPAILNGSGESTFRADLSNEGFEREYVKRRNVFLMFFNKIKRSQETQESAFNPARIFLDYLEQGKYNLRSAAFRHHVKETFLYEELSELVKEACAEIKVRMADEAINKKLILQLPLKFANVLFLGNTFEVATGKFIVKLRIHAIALKEMQEEDGMHFVFASRFSKLIQEAESEKRQALIQAMRILGDYQKVSSPFIRCLGISLLDKQISRLMLQMKSLNKDAKYLKSKMPDVDKMTIGSIAGIELDKVFQTNPIGKKNEKQKAQNHSFGELVQSIMYYKSVEEALETRISAIGEIKVLLNRFSKSLKNSNEWKSYSVSINMIGDIISLPIASMGEKVIKALMDFSIKMNRLVTKHEYKNSVIAILHAEWKRKNPEKAKAVYFYLPFLGDEAPSGKTNLLLEIRKARDLIRMLKMKKAVIFFPGATKEIQLNQMLEIKDFIKEQMLTPELYVETRTLDEERVIELSKSFYPEGFFHIDQLEPAQMPARQQFKKNKD